MEAFDTIRNTFNSNRNNNKNVFESLLEFSNLQPAVQKHLQNVYSLLAATLGACALGVYLSIKGIIQVNLGIAQMIAFGIIIYLAFSTYRPEESQKTRIASLLFFGFLEGTQLTPLIAMAIRLNPNIVFLSVLSTSLIFICFSGAALLSERRSYLYLGGFLMSSISYMLLIGLFSALFGFYNFNFMVQLYGGLIVFMLYIIYDTQVMVEKASMGEHARDYVKHTYELFLDFIAIFVRILVLLSKKEEDNKNKRK